MSIKGIDIIGLSEDLYKAKEFKIKDFNGNEHSIMINTKIKPTVVEDLVKDMCAKYKYCVEKRFDFNIIKILYVLLIKYGTDTTYSKFKSIEKQLKHDLDVADAYINLKMFEEIVSKFEESTKEEIINVFKDYARIVVKMEEEFALDRVIESVNADANV